MECIGKGKAQARFEFGVKVSIATTNAAAPGGQFVLGARALPGNPYDGHTLAAQIAQTERITGVGIERAYVDRGYRGHDADKRPRLPLRPEARHHADHPPRAAAAQRHRARHRPHEERRPSRPQLPAGTEGDAANVILAAAGHNLRLLRAWLAWLFAFLLGLLVASTTGLRRRPAATCGRLKTAFFTGD